jgi:predicted house-cleaning noncanonical NTP pyrophosphatase (MazG superfamily)
MWANRFQHRIHLEWIWDGESVRIVQADEEVSSGGVAPKSLLPKALQPFSAPKLKVFRRATTADLSRYGKLQNAAIYTRLGYEMPAFYVLDQPGIIEAVRQGAPPKDLLWDLGKLLARPLVLRTDGLAIPKDKREMLPRSDELRTVDAVLDWIRDDLPRKLDEARLAGTSIALIAHHFIPSVASAWARAEPGKPFVRIESLWGLPEGLYWLSHDTVEVDTNVTKRPLSSTRPLTKRFRFSRKIRFKGSFIAPDDSGKWVSQKTAPPSDWAASIESKEWLAEIAWTTRRIAEEEKQAVSVMWFVGNHPTATGHKVLPWWHTKSALSDTPTAAPARKYRTSVDVKVQTPDDWTKLEASVARGDRIERIVVEPTDPSLVRNPEFATSVALLAKQHNIVVELSGGILSHAYYILRREGARVECVDLFGGEEDRLEFDKLVRDKVLESIEGRGERADSATLVGDALVQALKRKLVEEALETLDAKSGEDVLAELADVLEVVQSLSIALDLRASDLEAARTEKRLAKGGFEKGVMLLQTASPRTAFARPKKGAATAAGLELPPVQRAVIKNAIDLPARPLVRRPDSRRPDQEQVERMLSLEMDFHRLDGLRELLNFEMPKGSVEGQRCALQIQINRTGGDVRITATVRFTDTQLELPGLPGNAR